MYASTQEQIDVSTMPCGTHTHTLCSLMTIVVLVWSAPLTYDLLHKEGEGVVNSLLSVKCITLLLSALQAVAVMGFVVLTLSTRW